MFSGVFSSRNLSFIREVNEPRVRCCNFEGAGTFDKSSNGLLTLPSGKRLIWAKFHFREFSLTWYSYSAVEGVFAAFVRGSRMLATGKPEESSNGRLRWFVHYGTSSWGANFLGFGRGAAGGLSGLWASAHRGVEEWTCGIT